MTVASHNFNEIRWMGLSLQVPAAWEICRHGISPGEGLLALADRRRQRMVLSWRRPGGEPDRGRMLEVEREKAREESGEDVETWTAPGGWCGLAYGGASRLFRCLRYWAAHDFLLEATLSLEAEARPESLARQVLGRVALREDPDRATRWRAFGIDCRVPGEWKLSEARVLPMDVRLRFDCGGRFWSKKRSIFELRRMGMAGDWFDGDLEALARRQAIGPHPRLHAEGGEPPAVSGESSRGRFFRAGRFGPRNRQTFRLWQAPEINSVFVLTLYDPDAARVSLDQVRAGAGRIQDFKGAEGGRRPATNRAPAPSAEHSLS